MDRTRLTGILCVFSMTACSSASAPAPSPDPTPSFGTAAGATPSTPSGAQSSANGPSSSTPDDSPPDPPGPPLDPNVDPATRSNPEELQVVMKDWDGGTWFCTGTLIAKDVVLTAGHCVDTSKFASYEVISPTIASHPRVAGSRGAVYDWNWDDVDHPDLGIIKLSEAIELGVYATLTDVSAQVDNGQGPNVGAIVRTQEEPEAPFQKVGPFALASATNDGYPHSYGVPMFSHGGDSGAGIFLVENGKQTHKIVAVEHTPDPARGLDHVSRIDAAFIQWVQQNSAAP